MSRCLTMQETAHEVGLSYDRFRKTWRELVHSIGLPAPHQGRKWDADLLAAWKQKRASRDPTPPRRGREPVATDTTVRAARARAELEQLRTG